GFQQSLSQVMPHGLRSSTVPLIASSRTTKSVTKPTWYTRLQAEQAVGAREVGAKRTETVSGVSVGFGSRAASRSGPTRPPRREMWPGTESNCRHEDFQSSALPTELPGQKLGIFLKSCRESRLNGYDLRFFFTRSSIKSITWFSR